ASGLAQVVKGRVNTNPVYHAFRESARVFPLPCCQGFLTRQEQRLGLGTHARQAFALAALQALCPGVGGVQPETARQQAQQAGGTNAKERRGPRPAADPLNGALPRANRTGRYRLAAQEAAQVVGQSQSGLVALARLLLETLQTDDFEVARQVALQ